MCSYSIEGNNKMIMWFCPWILFRLMKAGGAAPATASMDCSQPTMYSCNNDEHMHRVAEFNCDTKYLRASSSTFLLYGVFGGDILINKFCSYGAVDIFMCLGCLCVL
jgi:hypothetical protein